MNEEIIRKYVTSKRQGFKVADVAIRNGKVKVKVYRQCDPNDKDTTFYCDEWFELADPELFDRIDELLAAFPARTSREQVAGAPVVGDGGGRHEAPV